MLIPRFVRGRAARPAGSRAPSAGFEMDQLEPRVLLSTVSWDGGAGTNSWHDKANWSNDTLPGPSDDVVISVQDDPTIVFSTGNTTVASLVANENLTISGGGLTVSGDFSANQHAVKVGGGTLGVGGVFHVTGGELRCDAGAINGTPALSGAALKLNGGASSTTFILGGSSSISGDVSANQSVWVRGDNFGANAHVTAAASFTNAGTIRLESQDLAWETFLTITSGTLTNTGKVEINLGSNGPNRITGSLENKGSLTIQSGASASLELAGGKEFKQTAGAATIAGDLLVNNGTMTLAGGAVSAGGLLRIASGALGWTGGTITGSVTLAGSALSLGPNAVSAATFIVHGSVSFSGNLAAGQTVWVQGSDDFGVANLAAAASFTNAGLIRIESIDHAWDSSVTMQNNSVLTNTGTIEVNPGFGGPTSILGKLTNNGVLKIGEGATLFNGSFTQSGGGRLEVEIAGTSPDQFGKLQSSGTVALAGEFKADYLNGFTPVKYDSIQFITAGTVSGKFGTVTLPFIDPNPEVKTLLVYHGSDVRLLVTSTADTNNDGKLDLFDFLDFVNLFNAHDPLADFTGDGTFDIFDFLKFINVFNKG